MSHATEDCDLHNALRRYTVFDCLSRKKTIMLPNSLFVAYDSNLENLAIVLIGNIDPDFPENNKMTGNFEKNVIFAILRFHFRK